MLGLLLCCRIACSLVFAHQIVPLLCCMHVGTIVKGQASETSPRLSVRGESVWRMKAQNLSFLGVLRMSAISAFIPAPYYHSATRLGRRASFWGYVFRRSPCLRGCRPCFHSLQPLRQIISCLDWVPSFLPYFSFSDHPPPIGMAIGFYQRVTVRLLKLSNCDPSRHKEKGSHQQANRSSSIFPGLHTGCCTVALPGRLIVV